MDRTRFFNHLGVTLIVFDLILSVIFFVVGYSSGSAYVRGIGVGLTIAWVTSAIAHFVRREKLKTAKNA